MLAGYLPRLIDGTWVTVQLTASALGLGLSLSFIFALARLSSYRSLHIMIGGLTLVLRGLPELLVLFFIYFGAELLMHQLVGHYVEISYFVSGCVALSLIFAAYFSQTLYGAYLAISQQSLQAGLAFGLNYWQRLYHIVLPQMWQYALPGFTNQLLVLLKDTSIVSLIGLTDIMYVAHIASSATARSFTFYLCAAGIYLGLTSITMLLLNRLQRGRVAS